MERSRDSKKTEKKRKRKKQKKREGKKETETRTGYYTGSPNTSCTVEEVGARFIPPLYQVINQTRYSGFVSRNARLDFRFFSSFSFFRFYSRTLFCYVCPVEQLFTSYQAWHFEQR